MDKKKLILAIQKSGRLADGSLDLLKKAGFKFEITERSLTVAVKNFPMELLFLRSSDIPEIVADGIADLGIAGENTVFEEGYPVSPIEKLGFGGCTLCMATTDGAPAKSLTGKRIATSYPVLLKQYLADENISATVVELSGSVELAPKLGIADAICDLVSSGATLQSNALVKGEGIFASEPLVFCQGKITGEKEMLLEEFLLRIRSVLMARKFKYVVMNAPKDKVPDIQEAMPGLKKPTISPLSDTDFVSISSVVEEDVFWTTIGKLKAAGATGILVMPIEKMIL